MNEKRWKWLILEKKVGWSARLTGPRILPVTGTGVDVPTAMNDALDAVERQTPPGYIHPYRMYRKVFLG